MFDNIANAESNVELKTNVMNFILREICCKYKTEKNPIFTLDEIHKWLQGFGPVPEIISIYLNFGHKNHFRLFHSFLNSIFYTIYY